MARLPLSISPSIRTETSFFCSACGGDRVGSVLGSRRWIRVASIAVLPAGRTEPAVRCTGCGTTHDIGAVEVLTTAALAVALVDATRTVTAMVVRTGDPTDPMLQRRAVQHVRTVLPTYDQNRLDRDMAALDPATVERHLAPLDPELAIEGKERLVAGMVQVALAAHTITSHQRWLLDAAGTALGMTPVHVTGIISDVAASSEPAADDPVDRP